MLPSEALLNHMVEEAYGYVQGESLKPYAALLVRLLNSPITRSEGKMKFGVSVLTAALLLGGCATATSLRQGAPDLDMTTNVPAERVAGCVGDKLEAHPLAASTMFSTRPTTTGYSISGVQTMPGLYAAGGTDTIILVDIAMLEATTRVQVFTHLFMGSGQISALVRGCL